MAPFGRSTSSAAAAAASADLTKMTFKDGATHNKLANGTFIKGTISYQEIGKIKSAPVTQVRVNGALKGTVSLDYLDGFYYNPKWGAGKVVLGPTTLDTTDGTIVDQTKSNTFRVRYGLRASGSLAIKRRGSNLTFSAKQVQYFQKTTYVSAGKAAIQTKKKTGWVTIKTLKLNSKGEATYKLKYSKKRSYRLHISTSTTRKGGNTKTIKI